MNRFMGEGSGLDLGKDIVGVPFPLLSHLSLHLYSIIPLLLFLFPLYYFCLLVFTLNTVSKSSPRKKEVSFEIDGDEAAMVTAVEVDGESSMLSSITTLSPHGTRDLREVVHEIRDEFETASNNGKEVALLLKAWKPPYKSSFAAFRVIFSRILQMVAPSSSPWHPPSMPPIQFSSRTMKLAKTYCGEPGKRLHIKSRKPFFYIGKALCLGKEIVLNSLYST